MTNKYLLLIISVLLVGFSSCVSKKKYLEMEAGRLKAEKMSRQLDEANNAKAARIEALIADFESMKNELLLNNSIKDSKIDSLNGEIFILAENLNKQKESLQETSFNLDFEKQRLTSALNAKDRSLKSLQTQVEQLGTEVANKNTVIDQKNFDIRRLEDEATVLENKVKAGDNRVDLLKTELENVKAEIGKLQTEIKQKEATITKLENNVKLLKKEIGG